MEAKDRSSISPSIKWGCWTRWCLRFLLVLSMSQSLRQGCVGRDCVLSWTVVCPACSSGHRMKSRELGGRARMRLVPTLQRDPLPNSVLGGKGEGKLRWWWWTPALPSPFLVARVQVCRPHLHLPLLHPGPGDNLDRPERCDPGADGR